METTDISFEKFQKDTWDEHNAICTKFRNRLMTIVQQIANDNDCAFTFMGDLILVAHDHPKRDELFDLVNKYARQFSSTFKTDIRFCNINPIK